MKQEQIASTRLAAHIKKHNSKIIHRFDLAADMRLTPGQARRAKELQGDTGYPDIFIAEPRSSYHGLYIEMKKDRSEVYKKDGTYRAGAHLLEQIIMRKKLQARGYRVEWGLGFEDAKEKLETYLALDS